MAYEAGAEAGVGGGGGINMLCTACSKHASLGQNDQNVWQSRFLISQGRAHVNVKMCQSMTKPTKWHLHPSKTQISLGTRLV